MDQGRDNLGARGRIYWWWGEFKLVAKRLFALVPCKLFTGIQSHTILSASAGVAEAFITIDKFNEDNESDIWQLIPVTFANAGFFLWSFLPHSPPPIPRLLWVTIPKSGYSCTAPWFRRKLLRWGNTWTLTFSHLYRAFLNIKLNII